MAFPERLLSEDEELIYDLRPHWLTLVVPVLITVAVMVAVAAAWVVMPAGDLQQPARMVVGVLGLVVLLATVVGRATTTSGSSARSAGCCAGRPPISCSPPSG